MREHPEPRPRDHTDVAQDIARDLADIAGQRPSGHDPALIREMMGG